MHTVRLSTYGLSVDRINESIEAYWRDAATPLSDDEREALTEQVMDAAAEALGANYVTPATGEAHFSKQPSDAEDDLERGEAATLAIGAVIERFATEREA